MTKKDLLWKEELTLAIIAIVVIIGIISFLVNPTITGYTTSLKEIVTVIGTWMLLGIMAIGFMAIFLAVVHKGRKKPKRKRSR